jgi:broad specificity polyphosphatase/5'/3'-nucleotidase SurE
MEKANLLDAICIGKENDKKASESYANAAKRIDTLGKRLFETLSEFEQFHNVNLPSENSLPHNGIEQLQ